jgi:hypothetical protein
LMMVVATVSESPQKRSQAAAAIGEVVTGEVVGTGIVIHEEKVFIQYATKISGLWIQGRRTT